MVNLPFSIEQRPNAEFMSPNGVVPFLRLESTLTSGFSDIVDLVSQKVGPFFGTYFYFTLLGHQTHKYA
jgi:hypothetical protein